jgi:phospholipid/cholesterol/gamma-HCH transport system substrate-binding protein
MTQVEHQDSPKPHKRKSLDFLLGLFVVAAVLLLLFVIFVIGKQRHLFESSATIKAQYSNVAGLQKGGDVLLGGVIIGQVNDIEFPPMDPKSTAAQEITVIMRVTQSMLPWIRKDSVARVDSKGLLGDKVINISVGTPTMPPVKDGDVLISQAPPDLGQAMSKVGQVLDDAAVGIADIKKVLSGFVAEGGDVALGKAAVSLKNLVKQVEEGGGVLHQLLYDEKAGEDVKKAVHEFAVTTEEVGRAARQVSVLLKEAEHGEGLAHALFYDKAGGQAVKSLNAVLGEIQGVVADVKKGPGILHDLVYADSNKHLLSNLNQASDDLRLIMEKLKRGEGTLGRLWTDPSLFDELKQLVSKVRRNEVLRVLIRHGISDQESKGAK